MNREEPDGAKGQIRVIDGRRLDHLVFEDLRGVAVVMPCSDIARGLETARVLVRRAGMVMTLFLVEDILPLEFTRVLNRAVAQINSGYIVYLSEDVFPGVDWLKLAFRTMEETGKGLLSFNCGRRSEHIATFGMVRMEWVKGLYGGPVFFPGYRAFEAVRELTLIARAGNNVAFNPDCVLVNIEKSNILLQNAGNLGANPVQGDRLLFSRRLEGCFGGMFKKENLQPYEGEYFGEQKRSAESIGSGLNDEKPVYIDIKDVSALNYTDPGGVAVIMPSINVEKGMGTARQLILYAGMSAKIFVVEDTLRQGFIKTLNETAARISSKYLVYLAEDALPGIGWLKTAHRRLEENGKGLLAFNCGVWHGRIAAFGMVRTEWVRKLYGGPIFFPGYRAHRADNELTVIARVTDEYIYCPEALLVEYDRERVFRKREADALNFTPHDRDLFIERYNAGFYGLAPFRRLRPLAETYNVPHPSFTRRLYRGIFRKTPGEEPAGQRLPGKDTFALYRIIGNDLYPRHKIGQARENLLFILENEEMFGNCEKFFIVNRIICPDEEQKIIDILETHNARYVRLPFSVEEYRRIDLDRRALRGLTRKEMIRLKEEKLQRLLLALYRLKNNYVMNINGARNFALREGKARAKWSLIFDGGCFITPAAWQQITGDIMVSPHLKYFFVPMTRVHSNAELLCGGFTPKPVEEPQLIFREDSREEFNMAFPYGRRDKVELLWRLQISGKWDSYRDDPWDQGRPSPSPEAHLVGTAGWIARLFTGMGCLETQDTEGARQRYLARADAILSTLQSIDGPLNGAAAPPGCLRDSIAAIAANENCKNKYAMMLQEILKTM